MSVKRVAFGPNRVTRYRIRALLYTARPDWDAPATGTPR